MQYLFSLLGMAVWFLLTSVSYADSPAEYQAIFDQVDQVFAQLHSRDSLLDRTMSNYNTPTPEIGPLVEALKKKLARDPSIQKQIKSDAGVKALYVQTMNQLKHVTKPIPTITFLVALILFDRQRLS